MFERSEKFDLNSFGLSEEVDELWTEINDPEFLNEKIREIIDKNKNKFKSEENGYCYCCDGNVSFSFLTKVNGTYNFNRGKYRICDYYLCPVCIYVSVYHDDYANYCGKKCTQDDKGVGLEYKISDSHEESDWCFVHLSVKDSRELYCYDCDYNGYSCYLCNIDKRFCNN
jgi:hypothetical protein